MIIFLFSFQYVVIDTLLNVNILNTGFINILKNSDTIICGIDTLQRNIHYSIDYSSGEIYFFKNYNERLFIKFKVMPYFVKNKYSLKEKMEQKDFIKEQDSLDIEGTSGIYFNVSNSGRNFEQSLDVKIGGNVGEFNIEGVITDNDVPYGMGIIGISDVDNLYLAIDSPNKGFIIGNFLKDNSIRITGMGIRYRIFRFDAGISGVKIGSVYMNGVDGISGGYRIKDQDGNYIKIIQGSEKVFLNGEMLKYKEDYLMDYENSEIIFTPKRIIKSDDIIYISFQYFSGGAKEVIYSGTMRTKPLDISFQSKEDLEEEYLLRKAIIDSGFAYVYDANYVGLGKGDYELVDSFFIYKGIKKGSYIVNFTYKGENMGEYEYIDSLGYFLFTGTGKWSAIRKIPLYGKNRSLSLKIDVGSKIIKFNSQNKVIKKDILITDSTSLKVTTFENIRFIFPMITMNLDLYVNTNPRKDIEWVNYPKNINIWGENVNRFFVFSGEIKPKEFLLINMGYGRSDDKKLFNFGFNINSLDFLYSNVSNYKMELSSSYIHRGYKIQGKEKRFKYLNLREIVIESKKISFNMGRKGINSSGNIEDTSCFYTILFNLPYRFFTYSGNANLEKSFIDGSRRMNFNNTLLSVFDRKLLSYKFLINLQENMKNKLLSIYKRVEDGYGNYSYDSLNKRYYEDPYGSFVKEFIPTDSIERIRSINIDFNTRYTGYFILNLDSKFSNDKLKSEELFNIYLESPEIFKNRYFTEYRINRSIVQTVEIKDLYFNEIISGGINFKNNLFKIGFSRENRKEENRNFIFGRFSKILLINSKIGYINYRQKIFFLTINPELIINMKNYQLNLGIDVSYYKTEFPTSLYQDGFVLTLSPNLLYKISQYRIIFKGIGRIRGSGNIISFKLGVETDIKP